jgi:hypothetical protein
VRAEFAVKVFVVNRKFYVVSPFQIRKRPAVEIPNRHRAVNLAGKFIRRNLLACFINIAASSLGLCQQRV